MDITAQQLFKSKVNEILKNPIVYAEFDRLYPTTMQACTYFKVKKITGEITDETYNSLLVAIDEATTNNTRIRLPTGAEENEAIKKEIFAAIEGIASSKPPFLPEVTEILKSGIFSPDNITKINAYYNPKVGGKRHLSRKAKRARKTKKIQTYSQINDFYIINQKSFLYLPKHI